MHAARWDREVVDRRSILTVRFSVISLQSVLHRQRGPPRRRIPTLRLVWLAHDERSFPSGHCQPSLPEGHRVPDRGILGTGMEVQQDRIQAGQV